MESRLKIRCEMSVGNALRGSEEGLLGVRERYTPFRGDRRLGDVARDCGREEGLEEGRDEGRDTPGDPGTEN